MLIKIFRFARKLLLVEIDQGFEVNFGGHWPSRSGFEELWPKYIVETIATNGLYNLLVLTLLLEVQLWSILIWFSVLIFRTD